MDAATEHTCPECQGTGMWSIDRMCDRCRGAGAVPQVTSPDHPIWTGYGAYGPPDGDQSE